MSDMPAPRRHVASLAEFRSMFPSKTDPRAPAPAPASAPAPAPAPSGAGAGSGVSSYGPDPTAEGDGPATPSLRQRLFGGRKSKGPRTTSTPPSDDTKGSSVFPEFTVWPFGAGPTPATRTQKSPAPPPPSATIGMDVIWTRYNLLATRTASGSVPDRPVVRVIDAESLCKTKDIKKLLMPTAEGGFGLTQADFEMDGACLPFLPMLATKLPKEVWSLLGIKYTPRPM